MAKQLNPITINFDSREQQPWIFNSEIKRPGEIQILGSEVATISAGDYQIKEAPDLCRIEKKSGFKEIIGNYTPVANRERFEREMEKLKDIKYKYLFIETNISMDILALSIQQFKYGLPCKRVAEWLEQLAQDYGIQIRYVGNAGQKYAKMIFKDLARRYL